MTHGIVARRYANVLFEIVDGRQGSQAALDSLRGLNDLLSAHEDLRQVFESPSVPPSKKRAVAETIAARMNATQEVARLLGLLADRDRLSILPEVTAAFTDRVMAKQKVMPAEVTTAAPLDERERAALVEALSRAAGCDVTMRERVDPAIIGGVVARVGSLVFDGSVTRQLERMRERLIAES